MSVLKSEYKPGISCNHFWVCDDGHGERFSCDKCDTSCERDETGQIIHYTHPSFREVQPREPYRAR